MNPKSNRYICIHGHFYQPSRENPWLEEVELQDSAYPYHDWNERITAECYYPNSASDILGEDKEIIDIVNLYSRISFNFGPTLLSWIERREPELYRAILEADKISYERYFPGHGSALSQPYNHMIMPLANARDKRTQIAWGIKDFERRFNRKPEGMWLPETAVDSETLDIMAESGIKFTILAPHQAKRSRKIGEDKWVEHEKAGIDFRMPYLYALDSGRKIAIFFYNGPISHDISFGRLLENGENFAKTLVSAFTKEQKPQLVHIASDGETYGHHHKFGDMALAYCLRYLETNNLARITNYGEYLENFPPTHEVEIVENSSWSCCHGVERWKSDCGCRIGTHAGWKQSWRGPLRVAMDWLREAAVSIYEKEVSHFMDEPWHARDDYINVITDRSKVNIESFLKEYVTKEISSVDRAKVLKLMELQRNAMLMYASCEWFFDEISGIETIQGMRYAARVLQLIEGISGTSMEESFRALLEKTPSNRPDLKDGSVIYDMFVKPVVIDIPRVGINHGICELFKKDPDILRVSAYAVKTIYYEEREAKNRKMASGIVKVKSNITLEENEISFTLLRFEDYNIIGGAKEGMDRKNFSEMQKILRNIFAKDDTTEFIGLIDKYFHRHRYSLAHVFKDAQRSILDDIFYQTAKEMEMALRNIYGYQYKDTPSDKPAKIPMLKYFSDISEFVANTDIRRFLENIKGVNTDRFWSLVEEIKKRGISIDKEALSFVASKKINAAVKEWSLSIDNLVLLANILEFIRMLYNLSVDLDLRKSRIIYFNVSKKALRVKSQKARGMDPASKKWMERFKLLSVFLKVKSEQGF